MSPDRLPARPSPGGAPWLGYVLKAYPRASEPFILSEIYRLEALGIPLRLFATKPAEAADSLPRHKVVDLIRATPEFLTPTASLSSMPVKPWLAAHLPRFAPAWRRVARRHPLGMARGLAMLAVELDRSRRSAGKIKRAFLREFLHAVELVDRLHDTPEVRHLHAHYAHGATTIAWFASRITGLPFSFTGHAKDIYADSSNAEGVLRRKLEAARFAVTCTGTNRQMLQAVAPAARVHCLYHGLNTDFSELLQARPTVTKPADRFRILAVGRLVRKKGFDILIAAAAQLRAGQVPFEVVIVGNDGDHAGEIRRLIAAHALDGQVSLVGPQNQARLFDEYHRAHVFCLPCRVLEDGDRDGIPNVLMEAMACGTPVVTTDVSGIPEVVRHESNGLLVAAEDATALADALGRAYRERELMGRMAAAARRTARETFDGDRLADRLAALFQESAA
ncbi:MAG: glycosyltransferase family 4 protein [Vicinamibacterales bacterium]